MTFNFDEIEPNTLLIDTNEKNGLNRSELWEDHFKKTSDFKIRTDKQLPAGDLVYKNKKGQLIGIEFKDSIDLTISEDSEHLHQQIDKMEMFDKAFVVATEGFKQDMGHNNYWTKWAFKNIYFIPCNNFQNATIQIHNIFHYSNREAWIPEAQPKYSCKLGALKAIGNGIGDKTIQRLYRTYPTLDSLLTETDFSRHDDIGKKRGSIIYDSLHNT